jgi:SAM-dependent methyltransferase
MSPAPQWQFVGGVPENYERYLVPTIFGPWALDLVEVAGARPGERVLDIACGTGIMARTAARRVGSGGTAMGLDVSAPMLDAAREVTAGEGLSIEWREGSAMKLPLPDTAFDLVLLPAGAPILSRSSGRAAGDVPGARAWGPRRTERVASDRGQPGLCRVGRSALAPYRCLGGCPPALGTVRSRPDGEGSGPHRRSGLPRYYDSSGCEDPPLPIAR